MKLHAVFKAVIFLLRVFFDDAAKSDHSHQIPGAEPNKNVNILTYTRNYSEGSMHLYTIYLWATYHKPT